MVKVLFVCYGNICRSPMGEFILKDMARRRGISDQLYIASAATSMEETGNPVYPPARRILSQHGIGCSGHHARRVERREYGAYDYIIAMETYNVNALLRIFGDDPEGKIYRMLDFTDHPGDIDDPWYTGEFDTVYRQICEGCEGLLQHLAREGRIREPSRRKR